MSFFFIPCYTHFLLKYSTVGTGFNGAETNCGDYKHFKRPLMNSRELKQPRRPRQQKPHKFAYLTMKNSIFARFARAFLIFLHFVDVLVLSTT